MHAAAHALFNKNGVVMNIRLLLIITSALLSVYPALSMAPMQAELNEIQFKKEQETKRKQAAQRSADKKIAAQCTKRLTVNNDDAQAVKELLPLVWKFKSMSLSDGVLPKIFSFIAHIDYPVLKTVSMEAPVTALEVYEEPECTQIIAGLQNGRINQCTMPLLLKMASSTRFSSKLLCDAPDHVQNQPTFIKYLDNQLIVQDKSGLMSRLDSFSGFELDSMQGPDSVVDVYKNPQGRLLALGITKADSDDRFDVNFFDMDQELFVSSGRVNTPGILMSNIHPYDGALNLTLLYGIFSQNKGAELYAFETSIDASVNRVAHLGDLGNYAITAISSYEDQTGHKIVLGFVEGGDICIVDHLDVKNIRRFVCDDKSNIKKLHTFKDAQGHKICAEYQSGVTRIWDIEKATSCLLSETSKDQIKNQVIKTCETVDGMYIARADGATLNIHRARHIAGEFEQAYRAYCDKKKQQQKGCCVIQ